MRLRLPRREDAMTDERILDFDDYKPTRIARQVEASGAAKARLPLVVPAMPAGFHIALGAALYTLVVTGSPLGFEHSVAKFHLLPIGLLYGAIYLRGRN
jgi:formate/nitrite transporter FocA (FNT family)